MAQVKLNLQAMTIPEKVQKLRLVVSQMTGNAIYTTPDPPLTALTGTADNLENIYLATNAAREAAKAQTDLQNAAEAEANTLLTAEGRYVQSKSGGDAVKIQSAGMDVRSEGAPIGDLPAPGNLTGSEGDHDGEVDLHWNRVKGAKSYVLQFTTTPTVAGSWANGPVSSKSKATVTGLNSATKYYFRVAAIGAAGQGAYSEIATQVAP